MPNSKKKREKIQYDGQASSRKRKEAQDAAHRTNIINITKADGHITLSPWETQKVNRRSKRIAAGKTYENWSRSNANKKSRASVSNLEV